MQERQNSFLFPVVSKVCVEAIHRNGESAIKDVCLLVVPKQCTLAEYKKLEPLTSDEMEELVVYADEMFPGGGRSFHEEVAKIVYTLGNSM